MSFKGFFRKFFFLFSIYSLFSAGVFAEGGVPSNAKEKTFDVKEAIFHHLYDANEFDFWRKDNGEWVRLELPRILYNPFSKHLDFFGSTTKAEEAGYLPYHKLNEDAIHGSLLVPEARELAGKVEAEMQGAAPEQKAAIQKKYADELSAYQPWDFSITKNVVIMFLIAAIMLIMFINIAKAYKRRPDQTPKGTQSFFEPIIEFVREEIAVPNLHDSYEKYMPLLLSLFFFIWFCNMAGMIPFSGNITGNISVTLSLSLVTLAFIVVSANKGYWKHIILPPVPHAVKPILIPVEIIGIFTKPFALTIRLFANMTAGHVMMISLLSLIFVFGKMGASPAAAWGTGLFSTLFILFISVLELFVAVLQAYVFTILTAVFIGQAIENHNHHQEDII